MLVFSNKWQCLKKCVRFSFVLPLRLGDSIADCAAPSRVGWERYSGQSPFCSVDAPFLLEFTLSASVVAKAKK